MKFLILNIDYPEFLSWFYKQHPGLDQASYDEQLKMRENSLVSESSFYVKNLKKMGHEARVIYINNKLLQKSWAVEHGMARYANSLEKSTDFRLKFIKLENYLAKHAKNSRFPEHYLISAYNTAYNIFQEKILKPDKWMYPILEKQIQYYHPDVLLNEAMRIIHNNFLKKIKPETNYLIGQHAATSFPNNTNFSAYDLVISSFPPTVDFFKNLGVPAELLRLGFESTIIDDFPNENRSIDVSFIGSFFSVHSSRVKWLETIYEKTPELKVWASNLHSLQPTSPVLKAYQGSAWGREMYHIFHRSKITLNHHGDVLPYANNLRLYEATGMGALLITDWKKNLLDMFEPDKEVITYRTPEDCAEKIRFYLENDKERENIAHAGHKRTLIEHTYENRMKEFVNIIHNRRIARSF
jgi:hypothetical protein